MNMDIAGTFNNWEFTDDNDGDIRVTGDIYPEYWASITYIGCPKPITTSKVNIDKSYIDNNIVHIITQNHHYIADLSAQLESERNSEVLANIKRI